MESSDSISRKALYMEMNNLTEAPATCFSLFLGKPNPFHEHHFHGHDHTTLFLRDGYPHSFVCQPYNLGREQRFLEEWEEVCRKHGLVFQVLPLGTEWYLPGRTSCIEFKHDASSQWLHLKPYDILLAEWEEKRLGDHMPGKFFGPFADVIAMLESQHTVLL